MSESVSSSYDTHIESVTVVEQAARALFLEDANVSYVEWPEWDSAENLGKPFYIENAAAAFHAAFGGEQDD